MNGSKPSTPSSPDVESTLAYLLCSDQEQEAIDVINLLSRFADGDISPLSNHADSNDPTDRPA
jgi:hypothetical protein